MSEPFIGEIRMFAGNFAPAGWAFCNGQLLSTEENEALFALIGTTYGGNGTTTFALPNLQGRVPIHQASIHPLGQAAGVESVTLLPTQLPVHMHGLMGSSAEVETTNPAGGVFAASAESQFYAPWNPSKAVPMNAATLSSAGGSAPHENMQPYLCVSFIIALEGIYPQES